MFRKPITGGIILLFIFSSLLPIGTSFEVNISDLHYSDAKITNEEYTDILPQDAHNLMLTNPNLVVIDIREVELFDSGHIDGAINIPLFDLEDTINDYALEFEEKDIIIYSSIGKDSLWGCEYLYREVYGKVYNLVGGILGWKKEGYSISSDVSSTQDIDGEDWVVIDVRSPEEYKENHLQSATLIPYYYFLCDTCVDFILDISNGSSIMVHGDEYERNISTNTLLDMSRDIIYNMDLDGNMSFRFRLHPENEYKSNVESQNLAPSAPQDCFCNIKKPAGFYSGRGGHSYTCSCVIPGDPTYPDSIMYLEFEWGDGTSGYSNGVYANKRAYVSHTWPVASDLDPREYRVKVWSWTNDAATRSSHSTNFTVVMSQVTAPAMLDGPREVKGGQPANYTCNAGLDPEELDVRVQFDWGDGTNTTTDLVEDLTQVNASHIWNKTLFRKEMKIRARTQDSDGYYSDWSTFAITLPYSNIIWSLLPQFIISKILNSKEPPPEEKQTNMFPLLRQLLGLQ